MTVTAAIAADPVVPDPKLTPGAVVTTDVTAICQPGYSRSVRHTSPSSPGSLRTAVRPAPYSVLSECHGARHGTT